MDTNYKKALIYTLKDIMLFIKYAIYFWYINKNIRLNLKLLFNGKESEQKFYNDWYKVLYSTMEPIFEKKMDGISG